MKPTDDFHPVAASRKILRSALTGALATLDAGTGDPFSSLVTVATDFDGSPILLLSNLALHTQNLNQDPRAGLMLEERNAADPLQGARLSLNGTLERCDEDAIRDRFLARHPEAEGYAGFADFAFYRFKIDRAHLVAGFGRIHGLAGADLLLDITGAQPLIEAERRIVAHMNEDHRDALLLYATVLLGAPEADWSMSGCDPEGVDLLAKGVGLRLVFDDPASDATDMRQRLVALAHRARAQAEE